ncbi:hypothetical protein EMPS_05814 [Entomortierella parvispora]|uniref:RlpA-like protein double-psi beta-barrel domain-containing protein n=1 Tax=Entomortierella parvispora TaxID=205924 RepID=A0A9P3HBC0_9FUNG|nr:hypothetical protein EMPS_05814 [Entomortierella parvispora]
MAIYSLAILAASLLGAMAAPISHGSSIAVTDKHYSGVGTLYDDRSIRGACDNIHYSLDQPFVAVSADKFGGLKGNKNVCGQYVKANRADNPNKTYEFKIVDVCEDCDDDSLDFSESALRTFTNKDSLDIEWELVGDKEDQEENEEDEEEDKPVSKSHGKDKKKELDEEDEEKDDEDDKDDKDDDKEDKHRHSDSVYHGRGTWFSDTHGSCGEDFSQDDMIVALNEAQMGQQSGSGSKCGQKIRVSAKGSSASVVVRVVDTCPSRYCSHGQLDLSRKAFQKFASLSKGVLELEWSFV